MVTNIRLKCLTDIAPKVMQWIAASFGGRPVNILAESDERPVETEEGRFVMKYVGCPVGRIYNPWPSNVKNRDGERFRTRPDKITCAISRRGDGMDINFCSDSKTISGHVYLHDFPNEPVTEVQAVGIGAVHINLAIGKAKSSKAHQIVFLLTSQDAIDQLSGTQTTTSLLIDRFLMSYPVIFAMSNTVGCI